jgi:protein-disulfide isomerase
MAFLLLFGLWAGEDTTRGTAALAFWFFVAAIVIDLALLAVQAFAIHAFCTLCLLTYGVNVLCAALLFPSRRFVGALRAPDALPTRRLAIMAWCLTTLCVFTWAKAVDDGKAARAELRQGTLLGAPASSSKPEEPKPSEVTPAAPAVGDGAPISDAAGYKKEAERLQGILDDDAKLAKYLDDKAAREYLEAKVQKIDLGGVPMEGPPAAPVAVVEYSDFLCPHCRNLAAAIGRYLPQSGDRFRLYFKQYPLDSECNPKVKRSVHPGSCTTALGALCANEQGKFWQYHNKVFEAPPANPSRQDIEGIARSLGLDMASFGTCLAAPATKARLDKEIAEGAAAGVVGTPAIYVNGKQLPRLNDFAQVVEDEAAKKGIPKSNP